MENAAVAAEEAAEAFESMKKGIADSIEGSISMLDEFSGGTEATAEEIQKNLDSQIEGISKWSENMQVLAGAAGQGMSQELYDALAQMGPESANLVNTLVETLTSDMEQGTGEFGEICQKWQEAMKLQDESEVVASYTSLKDGIAEIMDSAAEDAGEASKKAQDAIKGGIEDGRPQVTGAAQETALKASQAMQEKTPDFKEVGRNMMLGVAEGIKSGQQDVINAAEAAADAALAGTQKKMGINSPSKVFRDKVGKQIPAGVTLGIKQAEGGAIKSAGEFAKAVYDEAAKQLEKVRKNNIGKVDTTLADMEWYWDSLLKKSKKKGKEYYAQMKKLIKEEQEKIAQQRKAEGLSAQGSALDAYKVYYNVSPKAEMQYWDAARKKYKEGTKERLEADRNYYEAKENYNTRLKELEEDYADKCREVNEKLKDEVDSLTDAYKSALSGRKSEIKSAFGTFDAFLSESEGPEALLENMKSQAEGYTVWIQQLNALEGKGILGGGFLEELRAMGPAAAATVASLNMATEEQLTQMQKLWEEKDRLSQAQAEKETESLRQSTKEQIEAAAQAAQAELQKYQTEYQASYAALTREISGGLKALAADAYKSGNDAVASLVLAIRKKSKDKDAVKGLKASGKEIGGNMLDGLLGALDNHKKIKGSAQSLVESLEKEIKKAAGIASPSKRFRDAIGVQIPAGVAQGIKDGEKAAAGAGTGMVDALLKQSAERLKKQRAFSAELAAIHTGTGISHLGMPAAAPVQQAANIMINNTEIAGMLGGMLAELTGLREEIRRMKVVLDTGAVVGEISTGVGDSLALGAVREIGSGWMI